MIQTALYVALGGAIGSALRYLAGLGILRFHAGGFPINTLCVNVVGSFLIGIIFVLVTHKNLPIGQLFFVTGILGGFTTFSAFSLETLTLIERGEMMHAAVYVLLSVFLSLLAVALGLFIAREIWV